jgi:hypothetical protein
MCSSLPAAGLSKEKYLISPPDLSYFVERHSSAAFDEAKTDPVQFLRRRWYDTPRSIGTEHCQARLVRIESAIVDAKFRDTMEHVFANLAGETFAYAISSSIGTSPEASIFIAGCFGIVVDVVMALRKD